MNSHINPTCTASRLKAETVKSMSSDGILVNKITKNEFIRRARFIAKDYRYLTTQGRRLMASTAWEVFIHGG